MAPLQESDTKVNSTCHVRRVGAYLLRQLLGRLLLLLVLLAEACRTEVLLARGLSREDGQW